jgi:peptide chain release factor subunit 1
VDVSYGGENGFNQAIELAADSLQDVKFLQEKKLISTFFAEIAQDTGRYVYGVVNTLQGLDLGAVEKLICWENLNITRFTLKKADGTTIFKNLRPDQEKDKSNFIDPEVSTC